MAEIFESAKKERHRSQIRPVKKAGTQYYSTVGDILDDMDGSNWMVTEAQVEGIRRLCKEAQVSHRNTLRRVLELAYEAGRQHDRAKYMVIEEDINSGAYNLQEVK